MFSGVAFLRFPKGKKKPYFSLCVSPSTACIAHPVPGGNHGEGQAKDPTSSCSAGVFPSSIPASWALSLLLRKRGLGLTLRYMARMVVQPYHLGQHSPERLAMSILVVHLFLPGAGAPMTAWSADIACQQKKIMMPCNFSFFFPNNIC